MINLLLFLSIILLFVFGIIKLYEFIEINTRLCRKIKQIKYPFLIELSDIKDIKLKAAYITQINEIARNVYVNDECMSIMSLNLLTRIINKLPSSWGVYIVNNEVLGYIHVQVISQKNKDAFVKGDIDENDLKPCLSKDNRNKVIHIGSVATLNPTQIFYSNLPIILIAGVIDKVIALRENNPMLSKVIACDFPDKHGVHHFTRIFKKYGFEKIGKTINNDDIYQINLDSTNCLFSALYKIIAIKRAGYFKNKYIAHAVMRFFQKILPLSFIKFLFSSKISRIIKFFKEVGGKVGGND